MRQHLKLAPVDKRALEVQIFLVIADIGYAFCLRGAPPELLPRPQWLHPAPRDQRRLAGRRVVPSRGRWVRQPEKLQNVSSKFMFCSLHQVVNFAAMYRLIASRKK
jgi:hypothetical protein